MTRHSSGDQDRPRDPGAPFPSLPFGETARRSFVTAVRKITGEEPPATFVDAVVAAAMRTPDPMLTLLGMRYALDPRDVVEGVWPDASRVAEVVAAVVADLTPRTRAGCERCGGFVTPVRAAHGLTMCNECAPGGPGMQP